ncbi:MAG: metalloprotease, partial [Chlamydiae bacterium]|nr:metalloprotease [Chlamydiota bacterium]
MQSAFLSHIGDSYGDFLVIKASWLQELDCLFREVEHLPTKAHILHIESKDPENLFCLSFQTLPRDSRGAPHILEHTVLCGSKKYPVKDPFFAMTRRSLNTFMNAFTGADFTCYPAASQVEKDFYHLLEVYVDAVFHANLHEESFLQEGCRLAFTKDETSPLIYQGIVYNEMKGARASCDARMWHAMLEELFPDLPYRYDSGGDPKEIPSLSYEELLTFYKTFYHPSRCLFFFSGDLPLKKHLDFLQEHVFQGVSPLPPLPPIPRQARYLIPHVREVPYQANEDDDIGKVTVAFGFLTCPIVEQEEVLALSVLDSILTDTDASPLKLALLETGLCTQAGGFLDTEMSEVPYLFVCKGCRKEDVERIEEVLMHKLVALSQEPLPQEWVEAALHQFELSHTEISGDHGPFGLTLFFRSALAKQHGCDPEHHLQLHHSFTELRKRLQDPLYLPQVIHKHLVANTHRVRITMIPDPHLGEKETLEEEKQLQEKKKLLSPLACQEILASMKLLEEKQQQEQNFDCLPKVTLADVPIATRDFPLRTIRINNCTVLHHDCFTNHFLYAGISFALPKVISQNLPYLQLLLALIPELGAGTRDYKQQLEYIHAHTGGLSLHASLHVQVEDTSLMKPSLLMRGKSLSRHAKHLLPLMQEVLTIPDLKDHKRIADLIRQIHTSLHNKIQKNSLRYAIQLALSGYSPSTHFTEMCSGSHYFSFMNDLVKNLDTNIH